MHLIVASCNFQVLCKHVSSVTHFSKFMECVLVNGYLKTNKRLETKCVDVYFVPPCVSWVADHTTIQGDD